MTRGAAILAAAMCVAASPAAAQSFASSRPLKIPAGQPTVTRGIADVYPSEIVVSGVAGAVAVSVTLTNVTHTHPTDLDVLLESPGGQAVMIMSDCGGGADVSGLTLTFRDGAPLKLPDSVALTAGTFRPTDFGVNGDELPKPAPQRPFTGATLAALGQNVNGVWRLWVADDSDGDVGSIAAWSISFTPATEREED
jgi:subtilisin-like proprotein convertase family protein